LSVLEYKHKHSPLTGDVKDTDDAIGVTGVEGVSIGGPAEGSDDGVLHLAVESSDGVLVEVDTNDALALKIPDLDGGVGTSAEPVSVGAEGKGIDDGSSLEGVQEFALVQVPKAGSSVFATRSAKGTVRGHGDGVQVSGVTDKVVLDLAVAKAPNLNEFVPTAGHDDGGLGVGAEADAAYPLSVASLFEGVLALSKDVP